MLRHKYQSRLHETLTHAKLIQSYKYHSKLCSLFVYILYCVERSVAKFYILYYNLCYSFSYMYISHMSNHFEIKVCVSSVCSETRVCFSIFFFFLNINNILKRSPFYYIFTLNFLTSIAFWIDIIHFWFFSTSVISQSSSYSSLLDCSITLRPNKEKHNF